MTRCKASVAILLAAATAVAILTCGCGEKQPPLIPRMVIFGNPEKTSPTISPDGTSLAYLGAVDGVLNVWVRTLGKEDDRPVTRDTNRGIIFYLWSADSKQILYLQDQGGNENWLLYAVDLETDETREFTPYEDVQVHLVEWDKHYPNEILIMMNKENPQLFDVYHLDLSSGKMEMVARNPGNVVGWYADARMKIRAALAPTPDGGLDLMVRETEESAWDKLVAWDSDDALSSGPVGFTRDGKHLYCLDPRNANAARLVKLDAATGELVNVLAEDPIYDISNVMMNHDTYEPQAVVFARDRAGWEILDEAVREDFEILGQLEDGDLFITSRDNDDRMWLTGFTRDDGPVAYYVYDRESKQATFLFDHRPALNAYTLAEMEPIEYSARDGRTIHGYMTYPPGVGRRNLPVVLLVHGGPWDRDYWGYNPEVQWITNRGYACLQVNFRGSAGYGKEHLNAGNKEWGGKMHNDLIDAVNWAIDRGTADPERVAIYGGSYGGYAALIGATFTPDVFCCAVDAMGPSNLVTFINTIPPYWKPMLDLMYKKVGNPETEAEFLRSRSPLFKVDQIKIPMLIAQGANDVRIKTSESEQIVAALREKGVDYEYMVFDDEGHGLVKPENRLRFYAAVERFFADHLGGRYED